MDVYERMEKNDEMDKSDKGDENTFLFTRKVRQNSILCCERCSYFSVIYGLNCANRSLDELVDHQQGKKEAVGLD